MKNTSNLILAFLFGLTATSCQNQPNTNSSVQFYQDSDELYSQIDSSNSTKTYPKKIEFKAVKDPQKNMAVYSTPIPSDWIVNQTINEKDNIIIEGSNNVKIYGDKFFQYFYSSDPYFNQEMQQNGYQVSPVKTPEQVIKATFAPHAKTQGYELVKTYKLPKLVAFDKIFDQYLFKYLPPQNQTFDVVASEWTDNKGNSSLMIIRYKVEIGQYQQLVWQYYLQSMDSDTKYFEQAKQDYLYSLENTKYNPGWVKSNYLSDVEAAVRAGKVHKQNMARLNALADAAHKRSVEHSRAADRRHEKFMDVMLERTTVSTTTGESYKVDAGSNYYWMNSDGQYISSDDPNYDPNTDANYNNRNWKSTTIRN